MNPHHANLFVLVVACMLLFTASFAGYGHTPMAVVVQIAFAAVILLAFFGSRFLGLSSLEVHQLLQAVISLGFALTVVGFWWMTAKGTLARVRKDEGERMVVNCCAWVVTMSAPHVLQMQRWLRSLVYLHAFATMITSPHWCLHLLLAMSVGEAFGITIERMLQTVEQLRREKERVSYDLLLSQHAMVARKHTSSHTSDSENSEIAEITGGSFSRARPPRSLSSWSEDWNDDEPVPGREEHRPRVDRRIRERSKAALWNDG